MGKLSSGILGAIQGFTGAGAQLSDERIKQLAEASRMKAEATMRRNDIIMGDKFARQRSADEFKRSQQAGETDYQRRTAEEEKKYGRRMTEEEKKYQRRQTQDATEWDRRMEVMEKKGAFDKTGKSYKETVSDQKYNVEQAVQALNLQLNPLGLMAQKDPASNQIVVTVPSDKNGKPDPKAMAAIQNSGLQYSVGQPYMTKDRWGPSNEYGVDVLIGGLSGQQAEPGGTGTPGAASGSVLDQLLARIPDDDKTETAIAENTESEERENNGRGILGGPNAASADSSLPPRPQERIASPNTKKHMKGILEKYTPDTNLPYDASQWEVEIENGVMMVRDSVAGFRKMTQEEIEYWASAMEQGGAKRNPLQMQ